MAAGAVVAVVPVPVAEVAAGVAGAAGNEVSGVGSGGKGFESTLATNSVIPASDLLLRYLYHSIKVAVQAFFGSAYFASVPASASAHA